MYECLYTCGFLKKVEDYLDPQTSYTVKLEAEDVISYSVNKIRTVILIILLGKFHIHKAKFPKSRPTFEPLRMEFKRYLESTQIMCNYNQYATRNPHRDHEGIVKLLFHIIAWSSFFFFFFTFIWLPYNTFTMCHDASLNVTSHWEKNYPLTWSNAHHWHKNGANMMTHIN